jgi:hypothetical protein
MGVDVNEQLEQAVRTFVDLGVKGDVAVLGRATGAYEEYSRDGGGFSEVPCLGEKLCGR